VFLAHYVGGGIKDILELDVFDFIDFLKSAIKLYEIELKQPKEVILVGIKK